MSEKARLVFANTAPKYWELGYSAIPVVPGTKRPAIPKWSGFNANLPGLKRRSEWLVEHRDAGIGICLGTQFSDGTRLGAIDIDDDRLVAFIRALLRDAPCAKRGNKGETVFVRAPVDLKSTKLAPKGSRPRVEIFTTSGYVVIPPTIHPDTAKPYQWIGEPLDEVAVEDLPILTGDLLQLISTVVKDELTETILRGEPSHEAMLRLTARGLHKHTDRGHLEASLKALFPASYEGNTADEIDEMISSAIDKGLGSRDECYDPGDEGPVPLGMLEDGRVALRDQVMNRISGYSSRSLASDSDLLGIAPYKFWVQQFPRFSSKGHLLGIDARSVADAIFEAAREKGSFDPSRVRGRGVWFEGAKIVINLGGSVASELKHEYVCFHPIKFDEGKEVSGREVLKFLQRFAWRDPDDALLLLGWLKVAAVCGALPCRPHIFLTGAKNTGKTTMVRAITGLLDRLVIVIDGQTSEAGIRQKLGPDSLPVVLDEFESDGNRSRMRSVLKLARSAYSAVGPVVRGTPEGRPLEFVCRATFLFAAINPIFGTAADSSRTVCLELEPHGDSFEVRREIEEQVLEFESLGSGWCRHAIEDVELVIETQRELFRNFPPIDNRHATNMSILLAAAWVALERSVPDENEAIAWIAQNERLIEKHAHQHKQDDAESCLNHLLAAKADDMERTSIGELVYSVMLRGEQVGRSYHAEVLKRFGLRIEGDSLWVANSHRELDKVFEGSRWADGSWGPALGRLHGAERPDRSVRFGQGVKERYTAIPLEKIPFSIADDLEEDNEY